MYKYDTDTIRYSLSYSVLKRYSNAPQSPMRFQSLSNLSTIVYR